MRRCVALRFLYKVVKALMVLFIFIVLRFKLMAFFIFINRWRVLFLVVDSNERSSKVGVVKYIFSVQFLSIPLNLLYIELSYGVGFGYSFL
ncbi:hypothetical protein C7424_1491 [Pantoea ananatis]|nr:hypothetical protein C7424_1491 [Pantoea ananatis]